MGSEGSNVPLLEEEEAEEEEEKEERADGEFFPSSVNTGLSGDRISR